MVRMSILRNYPIVLEERQIGLLQSIRFDAARKRVCALVVSCGIRGKQIVPIQHVRVIADGFILVSGIEKHRHADQQQMLPFVRDTTGILVGRVTDYAIHRESLDILAIEMISGYGPKEIKNRFWMNGYSISCDADEIVIPDISHGMPSYSMEGDGVCAYRR